MFRFRHLFIAAILWSLPVTASDLKQEIQNWVPGTELPHRLLSFPDGDVDSGDPNLCGLATYMASVRPFIEEIENDALLEELVFDRRSAPATFQSATTRLIQRKGLQWFSRLLATRQSTRWEHDAFLQMLQSRFAKVSVAFIATEEMPKEKATLTLEGMRAKLDEGQSWKEAYRATADEHPDVERRKREPQVQTTLVTYLFDGWVSAYGFDFSALGFSSYLPREHLAMIVKSGHGGRLVSTEAGVYLYYVFQVYEPTAPQESPAPVSSTLRRATRLETALAD